MVAPTRPLIESKMSKQLTEILERKVGIRCSSENFFKKFVIYSHVLWNLSRLPVVFTRKKRFERNSVSMPPTSTFIGGWTETGFPSIPTGLRHSASSSVLSRARKDSRGECEKGESDDTPLSLPRSARVPAGSEAGENSLRWVSPMRQSRQGKNTWHDCNPAARFHGNVTILSPLFDQVRARNSRTPRPILRRMSERSVTPSA